MEFASGSLQAWFFERLTARMAAVFALMTGTGPEIQCHPGGASDAGSLRWRQPFQGLPGVVWIEASEKHWTDAGNQILKAAGIEDADSPTVRSTYLELLGQALSGVSKDFSDRLGREVVCTDGGESPQNTGTADWARLAIQFPGQPGSTIEVAAAIEATLLQALAPPEGPSKVPSVELSANPSKTFDLLLDVELPVSVSFGRASVALKDVIKLTTGAIIELNRSISEPVEVIVNNCVIARGEVVVVEGNFGVRIREVISRQERLRTLN
jgi:flagellar motor switch protein FliN/FliY